MSKSATELAHMIERYNAGVHSQAIFEDYLEAAKMLRTQHKQIEQLREALEDALRYKRADEKLVDIINGVGQQQQKPKHGRQA